MKTVTAKILLLLWLCSMGFSAHAGLILQALSVAAPSQNGTAVADNMINQSGLNTTYLSLTTDFDTYLGAATHNNSGTTVWADRPLTSFPQDVDFNLGGIFTIESIGLWNWHGNQALQGFNLFAANNSSFTGSSLLGSFSAAQSTSLFAAASQVFSFAPTTASFVRIETLSNHGSTSQTVISEVAFEVSNMNTVPEPGTLALLGLGFAGLGFTQRKNRKN